MRAGARAALRWTAITLGALILILVLAVSLLDWNLLKHPIERIASAHSGRTVRIGGDLKVSIWSRHPTVIVNKLTVGNPPWESGPPMLQLEKLQLQLELLPLLKGDVILPRVELVKPTLYLHQDSAGHANWTFENQAPTKARASGPTRLPVVRDLLIESGTLKLADDIRKLKVDGTIEARQKSAREDATPFSIQGQGSINEQPFAMQVAGGPLIDLDPQHPYPFKLDITAGQIHVQSDGRVLKPFDLGKLNFEVTLTGNDLAEFFYLTQLALPNTPPFKLHAHIERDEMKVAVTDIAGTVGGSDLHGSLNVDATHKRPDISGDLVSERLRMADLAASLGGNTKGPSSLDKGAPQTTAAKPQPKDKAPPPESARLFPDAHLQVNRVRAMDADVRFRAKSIEAGTVPFKQVALHIKLQDGILSLDPFAFEMPQGRITGAARINAQKDVPQVRIDVRVKDIQLDQLKGKSPDATAPLDGIMQARAVVEGSGDSVHRLMSDANGTFTLILPNGEVRSAFAELTGINIAKGLGLLIKGDQDRTQIRCGVAQFGIHDGVMQAQNVLFDTQNVKITGKGDIKLGPELLELSIKGDPKKPRFARLRTPIEIRGHLLKPSFGVDVGSTIKQGAIAAALGVVTPVAAILAFVDPGLAKDANCSQMLAEADNAAAHPTRSAALPGKATEH